MFGKNKRMTKRVIIIMILFSCWILTGCSWKNVDQGQTKQFLGSEAAEFQRIGSYEKNRKTVYLFNSTGSVLTKLRVRKSGNEKWGKNLLEKNKEIKKNEKVQLLLGEAGKWRKIDLQIVCGKDKSRVLTGIALKDTESIRIFQTEKFAYLEYVSKEREDIVSTKAKEEERWKKEEEKRLERKRKVEEARKLEIARQRAAEEAAASRNNSSAEANASKKKKSSSDRHEENCADSAESGRYVDDGNGGWKWVPN